MIRTKFSKKDFEEILEDYDIGEYKDNKYILWALQNTVYILKTSKGKFILKIFENADPEFISFQLKIIDVLRVNGVPVSKIIKSKRNKELNIYGNKRIIIEKFSEGKSPKKFNARLIKNIAKSMALMNNHLLKLGLNEKYVWQMNHEFKPNPMRANIQGVDFKDHERKLLMAMNKLNRKKLRKAVIHGDFHGPNLLVKDSKLLRIIDWDDAHEDYITYEIAVFVMDSFISKAKVIEKDKMKLFFKEYQRYFHLNEEEKKSIYYFSKQRFLGVIFWHNKQIKIHIDLKNKLQKQMKDIIQKYFAFNQLSLEEFLELIQ